jgi:hypothetical protein
MAVSSTVNYFRPNTGAVNTPPSQRTVQRQCTVIVGISAVAAADTQLFITHNLNISAADISQGFPMCVFEPLDTSFYVAQWYEITQNPNYVGIQKGTQGAQQTGTYQFKLTIDKRNTIAR